jgi:prolactin regulatory element-binding protein
VEVAHRRQASKTNWYAIPAIKSTPLLISSFLLQRLYHVDEFLNLKLADELELENGEDAPMSIASHPNVRHLSEQLPQNI